MKKFNMPLFISVILLSILFILFVLLSSSNAVNITDGLDGLATGLSIIAFITFCILSYNTGWLDGYKDIVRMFWIVGLIASMISLAFGIWL